MTSRRSVGGRRSTAANGTPTWQRRIDDPAEPLYTVAVVCDLLDLDSQTLRRLGDAISHRSARPSGNQRRYSRDDIERLAAAAHLANQGYSPDAMAAIHELEQQIEQLTENHR